MFACLRTGGVDGFVRKARVLLQLTCLLEIPPPVCWEELAQGSRGAFRGWADRSHQGPLLPTLKKWSSGASNVIQPHAPAHAP